MWKRIAKDKSGIVHRRKSNQEKRGKLYIKWKGYDDLFHSWIDKKDILEMSEYFPKLKPLGENVKFDIDIYNYATKWCLKKETSVEKSDFTKKIHLASLKSDVGDIDKYW